MGLPASGKSTYIEKYLNDCIIVSQDEIRKVFYGNQYFENTENYVRGDAKNIAQLMLAQGKSIVVDSTSVQEQHRREWKRLAEKYGAEFSIVFIDTETDVCLQRNRLREEGKRVPDEVITRMSSQMQRPVELTNISGHCKWWDFGEEVHLIYIGWNGEKRNDKR
jgi:predicted kinase